MILYNKIPSLNGDETQKAIRIGLDLCKSNDIVVEVGCYVGGMTAYICDLIKYNRLVIDFHVVDLFEDSQWLDNDDRMYDRFIKNTEKYKSNFHLHVEDSIVCSQNFENSSLQFLLLDTVHDPYYIGKELDAWIPKLKKGGIIARHDYHWPGIPELVETYFGEVNVIESSLEYIWDNLKWKHTIWYKQL